MRKSTVTESQIVQALKQVEGGRKVKDVWRELGISAAAHYQWKAKHGGLEAADVRRWKEEEDQNRRLKRMCPKLALENTALKDVITKEL